eukprot:gene16678-biopygen6332
MPSTCLQRDAQTRLAYTGTLVSNPGEPSKSALMLQCEATRTASALREESPPSLPPWLWRDPFAIMVRGPWRVAACLRHRRHYGAVTVPSWRDVLRHLHTFAGKVTPSSSPRTSCPIAGLIQF